jgi:4'-phosphopantetheinyl transferase
MITAFGPHELHVWLLDLSAAEAETDRRLLDGPEQARAERFRFPADRSRWIAARAGLRRVLGHYLDRAPAALRFEPGRYGKPQVTGADGLRFSLSHAGGRAALALASGRPAGVDIEPIRPLDDPDLAAHILTPAERALWRACPAEDRPAALLRCWCVKEAYAKGLGIGLALPFAAVETALGTAETIAAGTEGWQIRRPDAGPGYLMALAAPGPELALRLFKAPGLAASAGTALPESLLAAFPALQPSGP